MRFSQDFIEWIDIFIFLIYLSDYFSGLPVNKLKRAQAVSKLFARMIFRKFRRYHEIFWDISVVSLFTNSYDTQLCFRATVDYVYNEETRF